MSDHEIETYLSKAERENHFPALSALQPGAMMKLARSLKRERPDSTTDLCAYMAWLSCHLADDEQGANT